jgi:hypothetical protein
MRGLLFLFVVLALFLAVGTSAETPTCMRFLRISTLPRLAGMGEATVAVQDATWAEANPAHLANLEGSLITFAHTAWFEDISLESMAFGTSTGNHAFGISVVGLHTEPLDSYDGVGEYQGTFRFFDLAVSASYARRFAQSLTFGVTGKTLYEKIDWDSATGFGFDLGMGYALPMQLAGTRFAAGAAVRNIGSKMGYDKEEFDLPLSWQVGLSMETEALPEWLGMAAGLDYVKTRGEDGGLLAGLEVDLHDMLALRLGYRGAYEQGKATFGLGLGWGPATVDYAYMDMGETLGGTHRVSVGFMTGAVFPSPEASR